MTIITPEQDVETSAEILQALQDTVRQLRRDISDVIEQAATGETINDAAALKALSKVQGLIGACAKAEALLNEQRNKQAGIARGGHALDLATARADIGCKLDRLRRCCGAEPVLK